MVVYKSKSQLPVDYQKTTTITDLQYAFSPLLGCVNDDDTTPHTATFSTERSIKIHAPLVCSQSCVAKAPGRNVDFYFAALLPTNSTMATANASSSGSSSSSSNAVDCIHTNFYFSDTQLQHTPSRRHDISLQAELYYRQTCALCIQELGMKLGAYPILKIWMLILCDIKQN